MDALLFEQLRATRSNILKLVDGLSEAEFNAIPVGFNNNLVWHLGHVVVTQQLLCYKLAGEQVLISEAWIEQFRKGTKPEGVVPMAEIGALKGQLEGLIQRAEKDAEAGKFRQFQRYETSFGLVLQNAKEAFAFNNLHESLHLGYMMAQRRLIVVA